MRDPGSPTPTGVRAHHYGHEVPDSTRPVALVTGAGRGIGRAVALDLASAGHDLALVARTAVELEAVADDCRAEGATALPLPTDVTDRPALEGAVGTCVERLGGLDVVVACAGAFDWAPIPDADPAAWDHLVDLNLRSAMHLTWLAAPHLRRSDAGAAIFIASMAGKFAYGGNAAYVASKHGLVGFAGAAFQDLRADGVKVSVICPGLVAAGAALEMPPGAADPSRFLRPADVAHAVRFVVTSPPSMCPTEILLEPQLSPWTGS